MFTAKVYKICIASASGVMEERVAQDTVTLWNCHNGEGRGSHISSGSARSALGYLHFL